MKQVARTKQSVYSCPSLLIAENQEQGKDKRRRFCPELLRTNSFSLFSDLLIFFGFSFFLFFLDFPCFLFFFGFFLPPHKGTYLIRLTIHKLPKASLIPFFTHRGLLDWAYDPQAAKSRSHPFFLTHRCLLDWAYDPQAVKSGSHPFFYIQVPT